MQTEFPFLFVKTPQPTQSETQPTSAKGITNKIDINTKMSNFLNAQEQKTKSNRLVADPGIVLENAKKRSQIQQQSPSLFQNPVKQNLLKEKLENKGAFYSPKANLSFNELPLTKIPRSPQNILSSKNFGENSQQTRSKANSIIFGKPQEDNPKFCSELQKTNSTNFNSISTNSIKLNLPAFPYPKKSQYYPQTPKVESSYWPNGFIQQTLEDSSYDTRTCPSTPTSIADISSPWGGKCNFTWSQAVNWYDAKAQKPVVNPLQLSRASVRELRLEDFEVIREIGKGKYGIVTMVKHKKTGLLCALKTLKKSLIKEQNVLGQVIRQIKIQSILNHPNIIKLYGFFHSRDNIYLVMELSTEGQLYRVLQQKKRLDENQVSSIMKQLCQAVKYIQSMNIMHRDIKPENIVIEKGQVKLCDFGWSVYRKKNNLRSTFCGTPLYISPEVLKGEMYDEKSDIWSLGVIAYEMLIGQLPFKIQVESQLRKIVEDDVVFPSTPVVSSSAKDFVLKILKKSPKDRIKIEDMLSHPFIQQSDSITETWLD